METQLLSPPRVAVRGFPVPGSERILTPEALAFVGDLARTFTPRVRDLLARRRDRQLAWDSGRRPDFDSETARIREASWTCAPLAPGLVDRRVEITCPAEGRRILHALGSGAAVAMVDFEDALSPTFANLVAGQLALKDAVAGTLQSVGSDGTTLRVPDHPATLVVRPRGWHLWEPHVAVDGQPVPAALFDAGLFFFHDAVALAREGRGPYLYLPKLEAPNEARLWEDVLVHMQERVGLPRGAARVTVLVETFPALFCMNELLWELRDHAAGLNLGRWDLLFSRVKVSAEDGAAILPDRERVGMDQSFLQAAGRALIDVCHRREVHAMGGMAAQVPLKDPVANAEALDAVRSDKIREVSEGYDGCWVAHPALVPVARAIFDGAMPGPNQIHRATGAARGTVALATELRAMPVGPVTREGCVRSADVSIRYLAAWLDGIGCVALDGRMEDAATAEIARASLWQRFHHRVSLDTPDGGAVAATPDLLREILDACLVRARADVAPNSATWVRLGEARVLLERLTLTPRMPEFLTAAVVDRLFTLTTET
jgi:malate synthase